MHEWSGYLTTGESYLRAAEFLIGGEVDLRHDAPIDQLLGVSLELFCKAGIIEKFGSTVDDGQIKNIVRRFGHNLEKLYTEAFSVDERNAFQVAVQRSGRHLLRDLNRQNIFVEAMQKENEQAINCLELNFKKAVAEHNVGYHSKDFYRYFQSRRETRGKIDLGLWVDLHRLTFVCGLNQILFSLQSRMAAAK